MADFFLTADHQEDKNSWIRKWCETWAVSELVSDKLFIQRLSEGGFRDIRSSDYTHNIEHSARRMFIASVSGAVFSMVYNLFHPGVSRFAKNHYKCGYYQYKALKEGLWCYKIIMAVK